MKECEHDYASPTRQQQINNYVPCTKCGEKLFIEDYYWWAIAKEKEDLRRENSELKARLARLEGAINTPYPSDTCAYVGDYLNRLKAIVNETTAQTLEDIQAEAIDSFIPDMDKIRTCLVIYYRGLNNGMIRSKSEISKKEYQDLLLTVIGNIDDKKLRSNAREE